jgi:aspartyl/asparaginyl-tRNA synthetase
VRTRRDSKGGFSFLELNDGSCLGNVQVIAEAALPNYQAEILHLSAGCSVTVDGDVQASPAKGQATEVRASQVIVHGLADPLKYPLQKKGHSMEFLREIAHLRPRSNTFGAVMRVRSQICRSIHEFFWENGFLYVHAPIVTASDCEGAGQMFRVTTLDYTKPSSGPVVTDLATPAGNEADDESLGNGSRHGCAAMVTKRRRAGSGASSPRSYGTRQWPRPPWNASAGATGTRFTPSSGSKGTRFTTPRI